MEREGAGEGDRCFMEDFEMAVLEKREQPARDPLPFFRKPVEHRNWHLHVQLQHG